MNENERKYLDTSMKNLRIKVIRQIYDDKIVDEALLGITDLDIYSTSNSFFTKVNKAARQSLINKNISMTSEQEQCLHLLQKGNLFISAPTSFGKTFIALEYIMRNTSKIDDVVFVVPTIALMNEIREKCFSYFGRIYTLITSDAELKQYYDTSKKIIIVVPERISTRLFQQYLSANKIDLLVYDEIYKLNSIDSAEKREKRNEHSRLIKMNYIYKYLIYRADKILLLGPFIKSVSFDRSNIKIEKFITNLNIVYNKINYTPELVNYFGESDEKRFVYFLTPGRIKRFLENNSHMNFEYEGYDDEIIEWISENIHPEWYYVEYLKQGIGIHHGKTPVFLRKYIENEYAKLDGCIHTILCTSTLVEGINTPTNNLVIVDKPRNVFELNNLIGRVGRLNIENPKRGEVYITNEETYDMYNPDDWIDLKILFESSEISTDSIEDECLYLDKELPQEAQESVDSLSNRLDEKFGIRYAEIIEAGIEFKILDRFIDNFDGITNHEKEIRVISDIKFKILNVDNKYLNGTKLKTYSFYNQNNEEEYISFDPVYNMLVSTKGMKFVIDKFIKTYSEYTTEDINLFIDTLFQIDEFIKFKMMKIITIYELFDEKGIFNREQNRAFIQSMNMIKAYSDSEDGYERILVDLGFPKEDINLISNKIVRYVDTNGTENKLIKLRKDGTVFNQLSPFGKGIINKMKSHD
ncbi:DEAD/DEAH box helicase [Listeria booriae]|uniref:DEAD/DEAH box helicase n=1 Tax=Listeria booriae TaxID=1552123 RepID=A0A842CVB5_9LIST|nr:DEAD/DEAH box helicase [Listeria booriae]MBC2003874.1 DEAD/DEAH box helicase [Listeria booriae]